VTRHGGQEVVAIEREELDVRRGLHGCGSRHVAQEGDLAEVRAGPFAPRRHAVQHDLHLAGAHHVEAVAVVATPDDLLARAGMDRREAGREVLEHGR
jgi:uncharacterized membrane protein (DUF2068 family)